MQNNEQIKRIKSRWCCIDAADLTKKAVMGSGTSIESFAGTCFVVKGGKSKRERERDVERVRVDGMKQR
jgi:hypothetical protein